MASLIYISDTILMEKLFSSKPLLKRAGLFQTLGLDSLGSSIADAAKNFFKENFDPNQPGGVISGVLSLITKGLIFKKSWKLALVIEAIEHLTGIKLNSIIGYMVEKVKSLFNTQGNVSENDINNITNQTATQYASAKCIDAFDSIRKLSNADLLRINGQLDTLVLLKDASIEKRANILAKIFGNRVGKTGFTKLLVGIVGWVIKSALLGAGLVAGSGMIANLLKGKSKPTSPPTQSPTTTPTVPTNTVQTYSSSLLKPSGKGETKFINDDSNIWIVPLINNDVKNTVLSWATLVYPQFNTIEGINAIMGSSKFQAVVNILRTNMDPELHNELIMPLKFHSIKEVVDIFALDAAQAITKG